MIRIYKHMRVSTLTAFPQEVVIVEWKQGGDSCMELSISIQNLDIYAVAPKLNEILGIEVWHDCNEGWLDLGPCSQSMKIQYQLYSGQTFDIEILIWPHTAKVWCGTESCWVRTWLFLDRRWLAFSISHAFPVKVMELRDFVATVTSSTSTKGDKYLEVYLPTLAFGDRRQFAPVLETIDETIGQYIRNLWWSAVLEYIPAAVLDGPFDVPYNVTDIRNQDAVLYHVQETILSRETEEVEEPPSDIEIESRQMERRGSPKHEPKLLKEKEKKKSVEIAKVKFEIKLSGDAILAGAGRIVPFETVGERPHEQGEIIVLISSNNLPSQDDLPIFFVNVDTLYDVPLEELKKLRISQLYTRWKIGEESHESEKQPVKIKNNHNLRMNDHHAVPLDLEVATEVTATAFLENPYEIQLRGIKLPPLTQTTPTFFGYQKGDYNFGSAFPPKLVTEETDILIAVTQIDARIFAKNSNALIRGDYPLYPPKVSVENLEREGICTNDINAIKASVKPRLYVPPSVVLNAQMNLEVTMGMVGCKPKRLEPSFSRLFCLIEDSEAIMGILRKVTRINEELAVEYLGSLLTGFAIDTGRTILFFLEGPRDGKILQIWEMTEDFYPNVKPVFSSSTRYSTRLYPELLVAAAPFVILKMFVPLAILLVCPPIYARPALPLPTRSAVLKIGRLLGSKHRSIPCRCDMPTARELKSFRLELCSPPRPTLPSEILKLTSSAQTQEKPRESSIGRINWDKQV